MNTNKINTKFIINDYIHILNKIYDQNQYKYVLLNNNDPTQFVERLNIDYNNIKSKREYVIGEQYLFGDYKFKVVFLGCINLTKKEMENIQKQGIMHIQGMFSYNYKYSINVNTPHNENIIYYFATKYDYTGLTKSELYLIS